MAPLGMVDMLGGFSSTEVGIISLVVFLILGATLLALCGQCSKRSGNAYDVNSSKTDGAGGANGIADTKTRGATAATAGRHWFTQQTHVDAHIRPTNPLFPPGRVESRRAAGQPGSLDPLLQLRQDGRDGGLHLTRRCDAVLSPLIVCSSTMAAMGPEDRAGAGPGGAAACPSGLQACTSASTHSSNGPDTQQTLVCAQTWVQAEKAFVEVGHHKNESSVHLPQMEAERGWSNMAAPLQTTGPTMHFSNVSTAGEAQHSFRSPESVEMDEIMAAMVLTSLSCSPVVQSPPQTDPGPGGSSSSADMECGGGELSDSGSSGYWSWDHGNVSPAPSTSITEMDSSPDEGLHMELEQGEKLNAKKPKSSLRGVYKCLWPSCGKVLTSSVGIKRHIRVLHLGSGSDQSQREEDFYYTKISCESVDASSTPAPSQQALGQAASSHLSWASCGSPPASGLQVPPAHRPRSNSSSGPGPNRPSPLSQSAPSSFWQIHSEHLYQACGPVQVSVAPRSPGCQGWTPSASVSGHNNTPVVKPRCRSVSVGEQWLQQNRLQPMSASPSRNHCSFRKGRGEAKKCRKVYGVERKDQWCTACRWKKACQRFPD